MHFPASFIGFPGGLRPGFGRCCYGRCWKSNGNYEEMTMEWMTRFALILFVRMIARAEQAMLLARSARADVSAGRSFCRPLHGSHHASQDVSR